MVKKKEYRSNEIGSQRTAYQKNKTRLIKTAEFCALCKAPIDKSLKFPHPLSATVDHIHPIAKGGHPSDINNLQVVHFICNQLKGTKETIQANKDKTKQETIIDNRNLPHSIDWLSYRAE